MTINIQFSKKFFEDLHALAENQSKNDNQHHKLRHAYSQLSLASLRLQALKLAEEIGELDNEELVPDELLSTQL